ncbi:MAG: S-adenosylmethionine synthetase, partial [uncultured Solirubrobacteraceae bacterium]
VHHHPAHRRRVAGRRRGGRDAPPLHLGVGHRGAPRQDRRPDLGRGARRDPAPRPEGARGVRDARDHRQRDHRRRDHHARLGGPADAGARDDRAHRLQRRDVRLRQPHVRRDQHDRQAVARHRAGRGHGRRGRPGDDVRVRDRRDPGAHAAPDRALAPPDRAPERAPEGRHAPLAAPRRQGPGERRLRGRAPGRGRDGGGEHAARRVDQHRGSARRDRAPRDRAGDPGRAPRPVDRVPHQPDRPLRRRRADGRRRAHRPQDHRRHVRRHGPPRRRRVQRQGPEQGRPVGGVRRPLGGEERGRRGAGEAVRGAARLRDRRGRAGVDHGQHVRHGRGVRRGDRRGGARGVQPHAEGDHRRAGSAQADLLADGGVRTLRPRAPRRDPHDAARREAEHADQPGLHLGADRQGRGAEASRRAV